MNEAVQWSPLAIQKTWPMESFWIGLMQVTASNYAWDDGSAYMDIGQFLSPDPKATQVCYNANVSNNFFWTQSPCSSQSVVMPTLICEKSLCKFLLYLKYKTVSKMFIQRELSASMVTT